MSKIAKSAHKLFRSLSIGRQIGKAVGITTPLAQAADDVFDKKTAKPVSDGTEETPTVIPMEDDKNIRAAVLEREKLSRRRKGRASTRDPGRALGSYPTMLG